MPLTDQQKAFAEHTVRLRGISPREAALRAGCDPPRAKTQAHQWLALPEVTAEIERLREEQTKSLAANLSEVVRELLIIATAEYTDVMRVNKDGSVEMIPSDQIPDNVISNGPTTVVPLS